MICITQYYLGFYVIFKFVKMNGFNRSHRAYRHKDGCGYGAMVGCDKAGSGFTLFVCCLQFEFHIHYKGT